MSVPLRRQLCFIDEGSPLSPSLVVSSNGTDSEHSSGQSSSTSRQTPHAKHGISEKPKDRVCKEKKSPGLTISRRPDPTELQDDSFVTFSVGHLQKQSFSVFSVAKYARAIARADDITEDSCTHYRSQRWRHRRQRTSFRRREKTRNSFSNETQNPLLAPVRRCFYYWFLPHGRRIHLQDYMLLQTGTFFRLCTICVRISESQVTIWYIFPMQLQPREVYVSTDEKLHWHTSQRADNSVQTISVT